MIYIQNDNILWVFCIIGIIFIIFISKQYFQLTKVRKEINELKRENKKLESINTSLERNLKEILNTNKPFSLVASMRADLLKLISISKLPRNKIIGNIPKKIDLEKRNNILSYSFNALVNNFFPEVRGRIETEEQLLEFISNTDTAKYIKELEQKSKDCQHELQIYQRKYTEIEKLLESKTPFNSFASLLARIDSLDFDVAANFLRQKTHSASVTADKIEHEYKVKFIDYKIKFEELSNKVHYMFSVFPDLNLYFEDETSILSLSELNSLENLEEDTDRIVKYISKAEYQQLTKIKKYQLALDRYIKSRKDDLTIGLEYEMYVDYYLRNQGYTTIPHGIIYGLNDLGRDIIARKKSVGNPDTVYIIQCKLWAKSKEKVIHENVICQIFGSAKAYELDNPCEKKVIPVICTNVNLSDTAQRFAKCLNVEVWRIDMGEFPRIKCNINNNERIYHLPFDQQYWRTQIKLKGERYAWNVEEAEEYGFRRAKKHNPYESINN